MRETQETISAWGHETFGHCSALEVAGRMGMELVELLEICASGTSDNYLHEMLGEQKRLAREISARIDRLALQGRDLACADCSRGVEEAADIHIMNVQVMTKLGGLVQSATDDKMKINRKRVWTRRACGTLQHV